MAAQKIRPIIFSGEMVRAILNNRKFQTRRIVKPQPECDVPGAYFDTYNGGPQWNWWTPNNRVCNSHAIIKCPYGRPGDGLWVRETWGSLNADHPLCKDGDRLVYRANPADAYQWGAGKPSQGGFVWRSPRFMPRFASRITLEITGVRVERVEDISEEDAKAEGVAPSEWVEMADGAPCYTTPFQELWERIHGIDNPKAWGSNPFVFVIEFKRMQPR